MHLENTMFSPYHLKTKAWQYNDIKGSVDSDVTIRDLVSKYSVCLSPSWTIKHIESARGPIYKRGLTLIPAWISNHPPGKMWDEITYPFLNFNSGTVEV